MIDVAHDNLISLREVSRRIGVTYTTVSNWRRERGLEAVQLGGTWFTTAEALNRFAVPSGQPGSQSDEPPGSNEPTPPPSKRKQKNRAHESAKSWFAREFGKS